MRTHVKSLVASTALLLIAGSASAAETVSLNKTQKQFTNQFVGSSSLTQMLGLDAKSTLVPDGGSFTNAGAKVQKMSQYYDKLRVINHTAVIKSSKGKIEKLHGYVARGIEKDIKTTETKLSSDEAVKIAQDTHSKLYKESKDWNYRNVSSEKGIYITREGKAVVVYHVSFFVDIDEGGHPSRPVMMINANDGKIESITDALTFNEIDATGPGGNEKTGMYHYGTDYPALKATKNAEGKCQFSTQFVKTVDLNNEGTGNPMGDGNLNTTPHSFDCTENTARAINGAFSPLNDAHFFGTGVFNMYKSWYGINPLKTDLTLRVHYGQQFENAFWDGKQMTFGDGKDFFYPLVVLDVTAHEVSHGFTEFNSKLVYASQSGGINEAFSDMAGEAAEFFMRGSNDWIVGGEIAKEREGLRYMDDPTKDGISIKHVSEFKEPQNEFLCLLCKLGGGGASCAESCGTDVHHSSGIYNKVFHDVAKSTGWDTKKAFDVFVKANQTYWTEQTNFQDGAQAVVDAATDLGYTTDELKKAFAEAGINL